MKRALVKMALMLACSAGLVGCAEDRADLTGKDAKPAGQTPANGSPQPQTPGQPSTFRELPPLGSSPGAAPGSVSPGNWR
jgi:hypothetical protein